jgi:hypothetical protein
LGISSGQLAEIRHCMATCPFPLHRTKGGMNMSERMNIHYKLIIDPEDALGEEGNGVVFIDHEQVGRFAGGTDEDKLPKTAADAIDLCVQYCRTMQLGILYGIIPAEQTERYRVKGDEYAELARKIRAGEVKTVYSLSVERYLIRQNEPFEDFDESTLETMK